MNSMKKYVLMLFFTAVSISVVAYEWDSIGPTNVSVNNLVVISYNIDIEVLCVDNGIILHEGDNWNSYTYSQMPAIAAVGFDPNNLLVLLGDGSWSDGVYRFNLTTHQFEIVEWIPFPNFLEYCEQNNTYYIGSQQGMWYSVDGINFESIESFSSIPCWSFCYMENHFVVSTADIPYFSDNSGANWYPAPPGSPNLIDIEFDQNGKLYGVLYGPANSSGLYSSLDYGSSWEQEIVSMWMWRTKVDCENNVFVGWIDNGIGLWDPDLLQLSSYNSGLPNLNINNITTHTGIDCPNIVACTDSGAYILQDYQVGIDEPVRKEMSEVMSNFPNPFSKSTTIVFRVNKELETKLTVYNSAGYTIRVLYEGIPIAGHEYNITFNAEGLSSGVYFYCLENNNDIIASKRMIIN